MLDNIIIMKIIMMLIESQGDAQSMSVYKKNVNKRSVNKKKGTANDKERRRENHDKVKRVTGTIW